MPCLNLKFPPARKAWKIFSTKIRRKLRILQPPKKKFVYLPGCNRVHRRFLQHSGVQRHRRCTFKRKQRSHIFVDELFRPALDATVLEHGLRDVPAKCGTSRSIKMIEKSTDAEAGTSREFVNVGDLSIKMMEKSTDAEAGTSRAFANVGDLTTAVGDDMWESVAIAGTSRAFANVGDLTTAAGDDMWESVAMASPLMSRIDERAEEFITKFRAEMVHQEMAAGDL